MKFNKLLFALGVISIFSLAFTTNKTAKTGGDVDWYDFNEGFQLSQNTGKIAIIDSYTDWCGWCKKMDKTTYSDSAVVSFIHENFIPIKFNPEKPGKYKLSDSSLKEYTGSELLGMLSQGQRTGFPTTFFFIPGKNAIHIQPGYMKSADFINLLNKLLVYSQEAPKPNNTTQPKKEVN